MSGLRGLQGFIRQRLTAALDDVLGHLDRTIRDYEAELDRRHRDLLREALTADRKQRAKELPADIQQLLLSEEDLHPEQETFSGLDQDQEDSHIKQEEVWSGQEPGAPPHSCSCEE
ncbi:uncharacterized protein [Embiotoca jacksoni]|uniref:uncharacterized protein n=1 Tax=Embiotoca jacksoni TaxID=100190 RepID=UPI003704A2E7